MCVAVGTIACRETLRRCATSESSEGTNSFIAMATSRRSSGTAATSRCRNYSKPTPCARSKPPSPIDCPLLTPDRHANFAVGSLAQAHEVEPCGEPRPQPCAGCASRTQRATSRERRAPRTSSNSSHRGRSTWDAKRTINHCRGDLGARIEARTQRASPDAETSPAAVAFTAGRRCHYSAPPQLVAP